MPTSNVGLTPTPSGSPKSRETADAALRRLALFLVAGIGAVAVFAISDGWPKGLITMTVGAVVAGASAMIGGLLGFLFGIPRALREQPLPSSKPASVGAEGGIARQDSYESNTNLEQISDWLTKILVGVGLTQIGDLPQRLGDLSQYLSPALGGSGVFGVALVLYFVIGGFLFSYLWTRLYMLEALRQADRAAVIAELTEQQQQAQNDAKALSLISEHRKPGATALSEQELKDVLVKTSPELRDSLRAEAGRLRPERALPWYRVLADIDDHPTDHEAIADLLSQSREWALAEKEYSKLIEKQGANSPFSVPYRVKRALCRIAIETSAGQKVSPSRQSIVDDLRAGARDAYYAEQIKTDPDITEWMAQNNVQASEVGLS